MKKFLIGLLLLGVSVSAVAVDEPYDSHARATGYNMAAGKQQGTELGNRNDNPTYRKDDDIAAGINMGLGSISMVDSLLGMFTKFTIMGKLNEWAKDAIQGLISSGESKAANCPLCATTLATEATGGPEDPAYAGAYASFLLSCETMPPVMLKPGPNEQHSFEDTVCPVCVESIGHKWPPILFVAPDVMGLVVSGVKLLTTQFLQDANKVIAQLVGAEGHVTDKWVGPPSRNTVIQTMGEVIAVTSHTFASLGFDASEYKGIEAPDKASRRELFEYRSKQIAEDQRSLKNVTQKNLRLLYRAQQRSVKALTRAMELKKQLNVLADVDAKIDAKYDNLPSSLSAEASRRALFGALMQLKLSIVAARTKMRSEALELEFKPMVKQTEGVKLATGTAGITDGGSQ